ncbi:hypothetical protein Q5P01_017551 [Channa striata]|uniref:Uncharacterized protein n=1 Tax=Channa striata TaxID=64152 RepID=A0AA88SHG8_CHASR|nr:hypothetical protein Q5P01_017551 [Channa striata]
MWSYESLPNAPSVAHLISPDGLLPGVLSICLANEMQPITLQALLAANQMEMGKLRDDDGRMGEEGKNRATKMERKRERASE